MAKTSKKQIEEDERKIISELQKNAKESIDIIAKKCGFSRQKVWRIIKRLEKNKTIWGYFIHGPFDWALSITANSIVDVKRFTEGFSRSFKDYISDIQIMDVILPIEQRGIDNPHTDGMRGYF